MPKKFRQLSNEFPTKWMLQALFAGGTQLERLVKQNIRRQKLIDTSNYRGDITTDALPLRAGVAEVVVYTSVIYARIHEFGGVIRARNVPNLVFFIDDQLVVVKSVRMPARPHWRPALHSGQKKIATDIQRVLWIWLQKVAKL